MFLRGPYWHPQLRTTEVIWSDRVTTQSLDEWALMITKGHLIWAPGSTFAKTSERTIHSKEIVQWLQGKNKSGLRGKKATSKGKRSVKGEWGIKVGLHVVFHQVRNLYFILRVMRRYSEFSSMKEYYLAYVLKQSVWLLSGEWIEEA